MQGFGEPGRLQNLGGTKMAVWEAPGPPLACPGGEGVGGETILLLHGLPLASRSWQGVIPLLVDRGHRVVAVDLIGMGESDKPLSFPYTLEGLTAQITELFDSLAAQGERDWVAVGHDLGGLLALRLLARRPEKVAGAIALDTTASPYHPFPWIQLFASRPSSLAGVFRLGQPAGLRGILRQLWRKGGLVPEELVADGTRFFAKPEAVWALAKIIGGVGNTPEEQLEEVREELSHLSQPVLLARGSEDPLLPAEALEDLAALIPGARTERIPEAGHLAPLEQPEQVAGLIARFVQSLAPLPDEDDRPVAPPQHRIE